MAQHLKDMELKEKVNREQFIQLMRQWMEAAQGKREFDVMVKGQSCKIPADAMEKAKLEVEYEIDDGEYELQFTMKWR